MNCFVLFLGWCRKKKLLNELNELLCRIVGDENAESEDPNCEISKGSKDPFCDISD